MQIPRPRIAIEHQRILMHVFGHDQGPPSCIDQTSFTGNLIPWVWSNRLYGLWTRNALGLLIA